MTAAGDLARKTLREFVDALDGLAREAGGDVNPAMKTMIVSQLESYIGLLELRPDRPPSLE